MKREPWNAGMDLTARLRGDASSWRQRCAERCRALAGVDRDAQRESTVESATVSAAGVGSWRMKHPACAAALAAAGVWAAAVLLTGLLHLAPTPESERRASITAAPSGVGALAEPLTSAQWIDRPWSELEGMYLSEARLLRADAEAGMRFLRRQMPDVETER